jgi:hypothetical protein
VSQWRWPTRGGEFFTTGNGDEGTGSPVAPGGGIGLPAWATALLCGMKESRRNARTAPAIRIASPPEGLHRLGVIRNDPDWTIRDRNDKIRSSRGDRP